MVDRGRTLKWTDAEIIDCYNETKSINKAAKRLGVGSSTISRILFKHRVPLHGRAYYLANSSAYTHDIQADIVRKYNDGALAADLIAEYGGSYHSIKSTLKRHGCERRRNPAPTIKPGELEEMRRLFASGISQMRISVMLNRSQSFVRRALKDDGAVFVSAKREAHGSWNGGRMKAGEYVRVLVDLDDPFAMMRDRAGYVLEHRLVMARRLGRALLPHETVHHINGDAKDNRDENLQLRQGRHGKGVVMRCMDCGSHNVSHAPLGEQSE